MRKSRRPHRRRLIKCDRKWVSGKERCQEKKKRQWVQGVGYKVEKAQGVRLKVEAGGRKVHG